MLPIAAAFVLLSQVAQQPTAGASDLYKKILPSVMTLSVVKPDGKYVGTAFLIDKKGVAATAWHVIANSTYAVAKFSDGESFDVSGVIDKDEKRDVALIRVKVAGRPTLEVSTDEPQIGSKSYVIGSPEGLDFSITEGLISQIRSLDDRKVIQFSCPASPGNSGGPLVDENGKVLGVVSFQLVEGQNLNFAVPGAILAGLDDTLPTQPLGSVRSSSPDAAKVFSAEKYGSPIWDGTHIDNSNWWKVGLIYDEGKPVTTDNCSVALISFFGGSAGKYDARSITVSDANRFRKYLAEMADTNEVKDLEKTRTFTLKGPRRVEKDVIFWDKPIDVSFDKRKRSTFTVKFGKGMERLINREDAKALSDSMTLWFKMLKEDGLDVDSLPATP